MLFEDYNYQLTHLRIAPNLGGAPHKPILLLAIMDCIESGDISSEKIVITQKLIDAFHHSWKEWVYTPHKCLFHLPFFHMESEPFWTLVTQPGMQIPITSSNSIKSMKALSNTVSHALMDEELFLALCDPAHRMHFRILLAKTYFPHALALSNPFVSYMQQMEHDILTCTPDQYREKIRHLEIRKDKKVYRAERIARDTMFQEVVKGVYNFTCCISGLRICLENNTSLVDACHIVPFRESYDNTIGNGLALSPTLHRAFDKGLITIGEDYKVMVSQWFEEEESSLHALRKLADYPVKLPENDMYMPLQDNLCWHRERVFRG